MHDVALPDQLAAPLANGPLSGPAGTARGERTNESAGADEAGSAAASLPAYPEERTAADHRERGKAHAEHGAYDLAVADFTLAIGLDSNDSEAFLLRGQVCQQQGEHEAAILDYTAALQIDINCTLALAQRVLALTTRHDFTAAVAVADESRRLNQRLSETYYLRGDAYDRRAEWCRAVADFDQVVQLDPANGPAFLRRGQAHARLGQLARAAADFDEAVRLDPGNAVTYNLRGEVAQLLGHHDRAVADFSEALRLDPQHVLARTNRGDAYLRRGRHDEAIADYSLAVHLEPGCLRAYLGRSTARGEKGEYERALADFARALALDSANPFARDNPEAGHRLRAAYDQAMADLDRFKRDFRRAAADLAGATRLHVAPTAEPFRSPARAVEPLPSVARPADVVPVPPEQPDAIDREYARREQRLRAERYYRRGWVLQQQGHLDQAQEEYARAIGADAAYVDAYLERGQVRRLANRSEEAVADFTRAIELGGGAEAYLRRANAYAGQGQFDLAFADYHEAARIDPECAAAYLDRGLAHFKVGEFEDAAADADRALDLDPTLTRALFLRGVALAKLGDYGRAVADFDLLLRIEPENAPALNHRGLVHTALGDPDAAIADFSEALRLAPGFEAPLFNRGRAQRLRGACDEAVADFTEFIRRRPQNAQAHYHRGLTHLDKGNHDAAIADFTHAFQLDPTLTRAYQGCLDATRAKYESRLARAVSGQAPVKEADAPADPSATPTLSSHVAGEPTVEEDRSPPAEEPRDAAATRPRDAEESVPELVGGAGVPKADPPQAARPPGKLRLECPECGTAGLLDVRNLHKMFRCPGCDTWWRTGPAGNLIKAPGPGIEVEVISNTGRTRHRVPVNGPAAAAPTKESRPPDTAPNRAKGVKPTPKAVRREGQLSYAAQWASAVARTRGGRWAAGVSVLVLLGLVPVAFPSLFPSQLQKRGQKVSRAWLARDVEQIKQYVEPSQVEYVERWLKEEPPPNLAGQQPQVDVAVQRNDGQTAEVVLQIRAKKESGAPAYFVFRQRWVSRGGVWYVQPTLRPHASGGNGGAALPPVASRAGKAVGPDASRQRYSLSSVAHSPRRTLS